MTDTEPPTAIIPSRRCWQWWARRPHKAHTFGDVPNVRRCPGIKTAPGG